MSHSFIARQPIYDRELKVHGYELLFRSSETNRADIVDGEDATSQLLVNALMEIGLAELVGSQPAFVNFTASYLLQGLPAPMAREQVVLEILEDVTPTEELLAALTKLKAEGYTLALDDFVYEEAKRPLVELADMVKLDVMGLSRPELESHVAQLKHFDVALLAEKVETQEEFEHCKTLGFDYYQGYFFCKPQIVKGARTPSNRMGILRLLSRLQDPQLEFGELGDLIAQDVSFSYRILRYINSAEFHRSRKIESIHHAATMLGLQRIRTWATILAMSKVDDKPYELILTALVRARMAESLSKEAKVLDQHAFTVGLFSALDALTDQTMDDLLKALPLSDEINQALQNHAGELGSLLGLVLAYERGDWGTVDRGHLDPDVVSKAYFDSLRWTRELNRSLLSA